VVDESFGFHWAQKLKIEAAPAPSLSPSPRMAVVYFKVAKHFATPSGAYLEYMLNLPETMKCATDPTFHIDATFILFDNPETNVSKCVEKKGMTIKEYKAWLTKLVEPLKKLPKSVKDELVMNQQHLL
jgi:hypothetical protein